MDQHNSSSAPSDFKNRNLHNIGKVQRKVGTELYYYRETYGT